ncbi:haloacid dehalogenase [Paenibacillus glucanolyticus]|nr:MULTISPECIES: HAD hydrolase-like protein [Paenibacillus]AVV59177.1 haloacid dehalogenase [Paenibacillus glucanolyticus]MPY16304.1 HAD hydrolase-like protein [Paenibacillus glucanolyticus]
MQYVLDTCHIQTSDAVMIGDRKHDLIGAFNCGVHSMAVGYGYGSEDKLTACQPTHYVKTVKELMQSFTRIVV